MNQAELIHWQSINTGALVDTAILVDAIATPGVTRRYIAGLYGISLRMQIGQTDWAEVNDAIQQRWSYSGLLWIKRLAWKAVEQAVTA